ncbi:hypothetical protein EYF80_021293 [Liparis tanakae]|uniref:Uncharacterized protein n=1 Tax=Liparis tanakae TaxID=230148 RepID=A0A4Z2HRY3_9TELE|nr:hypothetical protein EYF80_021293 [Liparis tanakae]
MELHLLLDQLLVQQAESWQDSLSLFPEVNGELPQSLQMLTRTLRVSPGCTQAWVGISGPYSGKVFCPLAQIHPASPQSPYLLQGRRDLSLDLQIGLLLLDVPPAVCYLIAEQHALLNLDTRTQWNTLMSKYFDKQYFQTEGLLKLTDLQFDLLDVFCGPLDLQLRQVTYGAHKLEACQAILKARYFLHDGLWRTKYQRRIMNGRVSSGDALPNEPVHLSMTQELLSGCLQAATHSGIRSHHSAGHLEQPALHFLELVVVSFLFLHLAIQILHPLGQAQEPLAYLPQSGQCGAQLGLSLPQTALGIHVSLWMGQRSQSGLFLLQPVLKHMLAVLSLISEYCLSEQLSVSSTRSIHITN